GGTVESVLDYFVSDRQSRRLYPANKSRQLLALFELALFRPLQIPLPSAGRFHDELPPFLLLSAWSLRCLCGFDCHFHFPVRFGLANRHRKVQNAIGADSRMKNNAVHGSLSGSPSC